MVSIDLPKAFDTIPHGLLLAKLRAYGLSDSACELFRDYLPGRLQRVKVGDTYSEWQSVKRGVPKGSVLGTTHILWVGGQWFLGGASENFRAKRGATPKIEGEGGSCRYMYWFEGEHSRENGGGVQQNFSEIIKNHRPPYP